MDKLETKQKTFNRIISIIKEKGPVNQKEILKLVFDKNQGKYQLLKKYLNRGVSLYMLGYFSKQPVSKAITARYFHKEWTTGSHRAYFYTPYSFKAYKKLQQKYGKQGKNKSAIKEIMDFYRIIEVFSFYQFFCFRDPEIIRFYAVHTYNDKELKQKIKNIELLVKKNYRPAPTPKFSFGLFDLDDTKRKELENQWDELISIFKMSPYMSFIAFNFLPEKFNGNEIPFKIASPMLDKITRLFIRENNLIRR